jgi:hypothetical protein
MALFCQRIGAELEVHGDRLRAVTTFLQPRRAVTWRPDRAKLEFYDFGLSSFAAPI